ncbi:dihydrodipicolinate synthase/N-acetylneuraminate lyase [Caldisphaera lagunensis DSM 15908]|uniref:Dihydrodipicolinate synthase/N-acetylneuraminate lyase n=1 Tax=Caldisphaera lagunensis (strain DSM 15908 / JCM 11604 / ANMR 0165 / IC-154) TaxID=1056495 RepID=L0A994_CALLD|nr:dihydrodipicolinate synthase family protein [Caldisphaera lagunensis]AFZ69994.1 dihydrodipicolinate synthase/N-acetylneuraminate lyase [Caldisphaera lagunensis DSM 15908]
MELKGVVVPMITPFNSKGEIDYNGLKWLIDYTINNGVNALFPNSTTGEFVHLNEEEQINLVKKTIEFSDKKVPILPGITTNVTNFSISLGKKFIDYGADGLIIMPPFFFKLSENDLYFHFSKIAESLDSNIIIYNNPYTTGTVIPISVYERLVKEFSNVIGVKITYDSFDYIRKTIDRLKSLKKDFYVLTGMAQMFLPVLVIGGDGTVSGLANAFPKLHVDLYKEFINKNFSNAFELNKKILLISKIYDIGFSNSSATKAALELIGSPIKSFVRMPLREESKENKEKIKSIIDELKS